MRRSLTMLIGLFFFLQASPQSNQPYLILGTYTGTGSKGIYVYRFNTATGKADLVSTVESSNPSFLAISKNGDFVYAVNEDRPGKISAYSFNKTNGTLTFLNQADAAGDHPCYIALDKTGKWVAVGNYSSGTLALFPVQRDGSLGKATQVIQHEGSSVNTERQEGPHVHATVFSPDNKFLLVPDLGTDILRVYAFNAKKGTLVPAKSPVAPSEAGAGPRHLSFSPDGKFVYLLEELTGTIAVYEFQKGKLLLRQNISAQPLDYLGPAGSADIHVAADGQFLYASNRAESNTIGIFKIQQGTGLLSLADHVSTEGKTPRNFNFDPTGAFILAANQNSNNVVIFKVDKATGFLSDSGERIELPKPVCVAWIE
ncbi:MAG: lactonase family protein [Chitinophagales bacterium]|nr:lactonase family protein [Chitinophagales bacterium]